jgi:hypothetical protein
VNYLARGQAKNLMSAVLVSWQVQLKCQILEKKRDKIIQCMLNMPVMYVSLIVNSFDLKVLTKSDKLFIILTFLTLIFYSILFAFVGKNIEDLIVT